MDHDEFRSRQKKRERRDHDSWLTRRLNPFFYPSTTQRQFAVGPWWMWVILPLLAILTALGGRRWLGF